MTRCLLGVSFASVNRWEGAHSSPVGPTLDLYSAIETALRSGNSPEAILQAANNERGVFCSQFFAWLTEKLGGLDEFSTYGPQSKTFEHYDPPSTALK